MKKNAKEREERIVFYSGKNIVLRPIMRKDVKKCLKWMNDPEVTRFLLRSMPIFEAGEEEWIEKMHTRNNDVTLAIETSKGDYIGNLGIHGISWKDRAGHVGISIGEKKYWGKGYGTEALMLLIEYAFNTLNLRKLCLSLFASNLRAHRCYVKCGFKEEGRRKEQLYKDGRYDDEIIMSVFRKDWIRKKK